MGQWSAATADSCQLTAALVPSAGEHSEIQFDKVGARGALRDAHLHRREHAMNFLEAADLDARNLYVAMNRRHCWSHQQASDAVQAILATQSMRYRSPSRIEPDL
jgi:hypothetical protein